MKKLGAPSCGKRSSEVPGTSFTSTTKPSSPTSPSTTPPSEAVHKKLPAPSTLEMMTQEVWEDLYRREKDSLADPLPTIELIGHCRNKRPNGIESNNDPDYVYESPPKRTRCGALWSCIPNTPVALTSTDSAASLKVSVDALSLPFRRRSGGRCQIPVVTECGSPPTPPTAPCSMITNPISRLKIFSRSKRLIQVIDRPMDTFNLSPLEAHHTVEADDVTLTHYYHDTTKDNTQFDLRHDLRHSSSFFSGCSANGGMPVAERLREREPSRSLLTSSSLNFQSPRSIMARTPPMCGSFETRSSQLTTASSLPHHPSHLTAASIMRNAGKYLTTLLPIAYPRHPRLDPQARLSVVSWMHKAVKSLEWPITVFFIGAEVLDEFLLNGMRFEANETALPRLSTASLYLAACLVADSSELLKANTFVGQVPHVTSASSMINLMLELMLSRVNRHRDKSPHSPDSVTEETVTDEVGANRASQTGTGTACAFPSPPSNTLLSSHSNSLPVSRTPYDLVTLYLARMRDSANWSPLYCRLHTSNELKTILDTVVCSCIFFYEMGAQAHIPSSRMVAVALISLILESQESTEVMDVREQPLVNVEASEVFSSQVFHLGFESDIRPHCVFLQPLIDLLITSPWVLERPVIKRLASGSASICTLTSLNSVTSPTARTVPRQLGLMKRRTATQSCLTPSTACSPTSCATITPNRTELVAGVTDVSDAMTIPDRPHLAVGGVSNRHSRHQPQSDAIPSNGPHHAQFAPVSNPVSLSQFLSNNSWFGTGAKMCGAQESERGVRNENGGSVQLDHSRLERELGMMNIAPHG